jgi:RNA polymerase sigma-70 factor (family 1)
MENREPPHRDIGGEPDDGSGSPAAIAFGRLFGLHFQELYRYAYRYVRSEETAYDLVNEAFLRIWSHRSRVAIGGPTARSYLYTTVRYQALDHLRRRRIEDRWRTEYAAPLVANQGAVLVADPDQELTARETAAELQQAVDALPRRQRQVVLLRWQQQASYDQIAEALGISPKTVAIHVGRAIQRLREILGKTS